MGGPVRLDVLLVQRGLAPSRERAQALIVAGSVLVDGVPSTKPGARVKPERDLRVSDGDPGWVGRGAHKLIGALDAFQIDPAGRICADFGASTGGFTEVLLTRGAPKVYAIDVGHNQLAWKLRSDPRVVVMEGTNARHLDGLPDPISLLVGDLSFISLKLILPAIRRVLGPGADAVVLVKPQFEAGRQAIAKGGRVRDDKDRDAAITRVRDDAATEGFAVRAGVDCVLPGARAGNVEHFLWLNLGPSPEGLAGSRDG